MVTLGLGSCPQCPLEKPPALYIHLFFKVCPVPLGGKTKDGKLKEESQTALHFSEGPSRISGQDGGTARHMCLSHNQKKDSNLKTKNNHN